MSALATTLAGWAATGALIRWVQLGIQMRPTFGRGELLKYTGYMSTTAGIGYYLIGVEERQEATLNARKESLLAKRARAAEKAQAS